MKKIRKGKKMLLILLIAVLTIVAIIAIVNIIKNISHEEPEKPIDDTPQIITLPETTYSDMEVKNVQMVLLKENSNGQDETKVSFNIHNTTSETVEDEKLDAILMGKNDEVLGTLTTDIDILKPGGAYNIQVILKGDLTATTHIKLVKK